MIKFRCEHCGQKLGVPAKYAGKTVRCTGCKEGAVVPQPEPEVEPVDAGLESYDVHEPAAESGSPFDDLDLLGGEPEGLRELAPVAAEAAAGNSCPNCGAQIGPQAVICVQCGHNLKAGGKVKTKVSKERGGGGGGVGISGRTVVAWLVGGVVAGVCVVVWLILAAILGSQSSYLAWGTGGLIGLTVGAVHQRKNIAAGIGAVVIALTTVGVVKAVYVLIFAVITAGVGAMDTFAEELITQAMDDPAVFEDTYKNHMIGESLFEPELQAKVDSAYETDEGEFFIIPEFDDETIAQMDEAVQTKVSGMTEADKRAFLESAYGFEDDIEANPDVDVDLDQWREGSSLAKAFSWWDALWIPLCIVSAFTAGQGKD